MSKVKRYFLILPILCIALIPCTSVFVSAATVFKFAITEPPVDNYHGYILVPWYNPSYGFIEASLYFWTITPVNTNDNTSTPSVIVDYNPIYNDFTLTFGTGQTDVSYTVCVYSCITSPNTNVTSDVFIETFDSISYNHAPIVQITFGNNIQFYTPTFAGCSFSDYETPPVSKGPCSIVWGDDSVFYDEALRTNSLINNILTALDDHYWLNLEFFEYFNQYLESINHDTGILVNLLNQFYDDWFQWTFTEEEYYNRIISLLEQLIEGTEEYTESSTLSPEQDELNRVEDELLNNEEASIAQSEIKVEINESAMSYIWDVITSFVNSNSKVFGLFISILSLGIIALILNR